METFLDFAESSFLGVPFHFSRSYFLFFASSFFDSSHPLQKAQNQDQEKIKNLLKAKIVVTFPLTLTLPLPNLLSNLL